MNWTLCSFLLHFYAVFKLCLNASINMLLNTFLKSWGCESWFGSPVVPRLCTKLSHGEIQIFRSTLGSLWSDGENQFFCSSAFVRSSHPLKMRLHFQLGKIYCCDWRMDYEKCVHRLQNVHVKCRILLLNRSLCDQNF